MKAEIIQQGDVLFVPEQIPSGKIEQIKTNIIEHGEHTGHAHRLNTDEFEHFRDPRTSIRYLRLIKTAKVTHEEHAPVHVPPGDYRIGRVREKGMFDDLVAPVVD